MRIDFNRLKATISRRLGLTFAQKLQRAYEKKNVHDFVQLVRDHGYRGGIKPTVKAVLLHGLEQGDVHTFARVLTALAKTPHESLVCPTLVAQAIHDLQKSLKAGKMPFEEAFTCLGELDRATAHCRNPAYTRIFLRVAESDFGRDLRIYDISPHKTFNGLPPRKSSRTRSLRLR